MGQRYVVRNVVDKTKKQVKELTTGLVFQSASKAAEYFNIHKETVHEYAKGRKKRPQLTYRFEWVTHEES